VRRKLRDGWIGKSVKSKVFALLAMIGFGLLFVTGLEAAPRAGGLFSDSFSVTCGTSATRIQSPNGQQSYICYVPSTAANPVFVGDAALVADATAIPYDATEKFGADVQFEYCRVATTPVVVACRAQVISP
jgi:hypothetical protein